MKESDSASRLAHKLIETGKRMRADGQLFSAELIAGIIRARDEKEFGHAKRCPRVRGRNPLFDALALATGTHDLAKLTRTGCKAIGIALAEIIEVCPELTEQEIYRVVAAYKQRHPTWTWSAMAIAKHWAEFAKSANPTRSAKLDPYIEPQGWQSVLGDIGSEWEGIETMMLMPWLELSITVRAEILKTMQQASDAISRKL